MAKSADRSEFIAVSILRIVKHQEMLLLVHLLPFAYSIVSLTIIWHFLCRDPKITIGLRPAARITRLPNGPSKRQCLVLQRELLSISILMTNIIELMAGY